MGSDDPCYLFLLYLTKRKLKDRRTFPARALRSKYIAFPFFSGDKKEVSIDKDWNLMPMDFY